MEGDGVLKSTAGETETGLVSDAKGEKGEGEGRANMSWNRILAKSRALDGSERSIIVSILGMNGWLVGWLVFKANQVGGARRTQDAAVV